LHRQNEFEFAGRTDVSGRCEFSVVVAVRAVLGDHRAQPLDTRERRRR